MPVLLAVQGSSPSAYGTQPQVQVSPQNVAVHEGETLRLYCRASGSPTPKLTWLKNGGLIPPQVSPSCPERVRLSLLAKSPTAHSRSVHILLCHIYRFYCLIIYLYFSLPSVFSPPFFFFLICFCFAIFFFIFFLASILS